MTIEDINTAIEKLLKNKVKRAEMSIDKKEAYELRHRRNLAAKLETLWRAGYLTLKENGSTHTT